jgi:hypothetical protein
MGEWKLWCIYRVSRGTREMVGTRVSRTESDVLASLGFESPACFEAVECTDPILYQRALTYHDSMATRRDIDGSLARDHADRAKGLRVSLDRLRGRAA